ncbi:hypothetical protein [Petrotoga sp. 8T1HF07.NaAc.6.1]|uniref:hypothetical protein n=1 Tax=Petrotoga sp. 8T1HF07.NaAc.6.1 TaxID=1351838 RepID=UPI00192B4933|nr:hypothetical protein [Petrotoga sp. 8T1HF07.NaAc.6.1]
MSNIEADINKMSFEIVESIFKKEGSQRSKYINEIDKALGVLVNDGVYAYYVYVKSKNISDVFLDLLGDLQKFVDNTEEKKEWEDYFQELSKDLNKLLFFRELLEKVLIYARYHAKAKENKTKEEKKENV